jgi:hypothetical protein
MKVTMTKIWVIAGLLALIGIAHAQIQDPAAQPVQEQVLLKSNPYLPGSN